MRQKIALIEPFRHYEVLAGLISLIPLEEYELLVVTTSFCRQHLKIDAKGVYWYVEDANQLSDAFLERVLTELNDIDVIFFTTINFKSSFWKNKLSCSAQLLGLVHNSHNFFHKYFSPNQKIKHLAYQLRGDYACVDQVRKQLDRVVVPSQSVADYLLQQKPSLKSEVDAIEIAIPFYQAQKNQNRITKIIIPGTVYQGRRDYQLLFSTLQELKIESPVEFIFAGRIFSGEEKKMRDEFVRQSPANIRAQFFSDYVDMKIYHEALRNADFLLLPIHRKITYKAFRELRGHSCVSGNINDMVRYTLPAIIPDFYPLHPELEQMVERFADAESLMKIINEWLIQKKFNQLKENINLDCYTNTVKTKWLNLIKGNA